MPLISVIVPGDNAEKTPKKCVYSILAQTLNDSKLLHVDNDSTDCSSAICDEDTKVEFRVRVFYKNNGGVSSARNVGLDLAKGCYITFMDSNDEVYFLWFQKSIVR